MDTRTPPWPLSRRAMLMAAALATGLALMLPAGIAPVAPAAHADA